jgi:tetratricopeptide (TPR) repeat protein
MHLDAEAIEALFSALPGKPLQHLLTCARCRRRINAVLLDLDSSEGEVASNLAQAGDAAEAASDAETERPDTPPFQEALLLRALELAQAEGQRPHKSPEARLNLRDLLAVPSEIQLYAIATEARFRNLGIAEFLLAAARESASEDPLRCRHLATLATAILESLGVTAKGSRLQAEASGLLGESERRLGHLDLAEDFFKEAATGLRDQPLVLESRVRLCRALAALRQEQGRVDEALGLLEHASTVAEEIGGFRELAMSRLAYGWLLLDELEPERAILALQETLSLLDSDVDPYPTFSALHALALAYAELGDDPHLGETLSAFDELAPRLADPLDEVRIRWIKARVAWRQLDYGRAISNFEEVFDDLLREGPGTEAATAGLELARVVAEHNGDLDSLQDALERIADRLSVLPPERLALHLAPVLRFALRFPAKREGAYLDVLLSATSYVERARFNPSYPYHPTPEPDLTLVWNDLSGSQRRQAAQAAQVQLDRDGYPRRSEDRLRIVWTHEALTGGRILLPADFGEDQTGPG